ncbi:hypothetical protein CROQUDRAFT_665031, partial [Cronartium quercuum f. sp. fusiforme G11]
MEAVNAALDVKYQANPGAIKSADVRAEMQALITNRSIAIQADRNVRVMAAMKVQSPMQVSRSSYSQRPSRNQPPRQQQTRAPKPVCPTPGERDKSWWDPIPILRGAVENVQNGDKQCFWCGKFRHSQDACKA